MLQRTTVTLNKDYLNFLKLISLQRQQSLSRLVNEAVRIYDKMKELKGVQTQDEIKDMNNGIMQRAKSAQLTEEARVFLTMPKKIKKEKIIRR